MKKQAIICIDDEKTILESIKAQLKNHFGHKYLYEMADNADEALELIEELTEEGIDIIVIVSDWLMPGTKGDQLLIDVHQKHPEVVKIMLTGQADIDAIERAYKDAHLHRCLRKPWTEEELIETIESGVK
jgi:DNA-binding NtrC family response regulator